MRAPDTGWILLVALGLPVAVGLAIGFATRERPRARIALALASTAGVFAACVTILVLSQLRGVPVALAYEAIGSGPRAALALRLGAGPLGLVFAVPASALWMLTVVYSIGYMEHEHSVNRYFAYLVAVEGAAMGIAFSGDLLTFFVFYELLTLLVYPLVVHEESPAAIRAGRIYLTYLLVGETLVFAALFIVWGVAGYVPAFATGGLAVGIGLSGRTALAVAVLAFAGFSVKAAVMPMHGWLPDAMIAPTPVSAVLHAVAVVNVGVLGILSLLYYVVGAGVGRELGLDGALPWVAAVTIIYGSVIALRQDEIKRRLAYSTVSQLGYMVMGASLLDRPGLRGAVLHMFAHSLMKIVLFFCAGIIITQAGKRFFSEIGGLARTMPVTMACFTVGAMGMVGLPPAVGWVSKWTLLEGVFSTGRYAFVLVMLVSAFLNLGYYFPPIVAAYFEKPRDGGEEPAGHEGEQAERGSKGRRIGSWTLEAPLSMLGPTVAITLAVLMFGVWPRFPYWLADKVVTSALGVAGGG